MQLRHLTVEQIKAWINQEPGLTEQDIAELEMDPRVSVRRLAACCRHRQASLRQEEARIQELARQEEELHRQGIFPVAGIDEAGRGALAGPLVVAAVMFPPGVRPAGLNDSKRLTGKQRQLLYEQIKQTAADVAVVIVDREVIDRLNILRATWQAMTDVGKLRPRPQHCLVDGTRCPPRRGPDGNRRWGREMSVHRRRFDRGESSSGQHHARIGPALPPIRFCAP